MLNQALFTEIASGRVHLTNTEFRVWSALIAKADLHNYVRETQTQMADEFGIKKQHFSLALKGLIVKDMVTRTSDKGRGPYLMISPHHFWKGNADQHRAGIKIYNLLALVASEAKRAKQQP